MFKDYRASKDDLEAIEQALGFATHPKMRFVFSDLSRIIKTLIVSYDGKYIYVWRLEPVKLTKITHNLKIGDENQMGWRSGLEIAGIMNLLPSKVKNATRFEIPIISGGLLTPFIELQKKKDLPNNPYTTKDSYLATIIHELGHIYWNSFKLWWYSSRNENIKYLHLTTNNHTFYLPTPSYLSEVFAFCTEYYVSSLFWKNHKRNHDLFTKNRLKTLITLERGRNLDKENSTIEPEVFPHDFASILGKLIIEKRPNTWPKILTNYRPAILL